MSSTKSLDYMRQASSRFGEVKVLELFAGILFVWKGTIPSWTLGIPASHVGALLLCLAIVARAGVEVSRQITLILIAAFILVFWIVLNSLTLGSTEYTRMGMMIVWFLIAWGIATGRIYLWSFSVGAALGLTIGVAYGLAFIGSSDYVGRLTGILGDPNTASMIILSAGLVAVGTLSEKKHKFALWCVIVVGVIGTDSRTSMAALAAAILWMVVAPRISRMIGLGAVAGLVLYLYFRGHELGQTDIFSDRAGSDALRERLLPAELAKVGESPLRGQGLGEAFVLVDGSVRLFFHSSYLAQMVEAGYLSLIGWIVVALSSYMVATASSKRNYKYEASLITVAITAVNLGEVLMTPFAAMSIGVLLWWGNKNRTTALTPQCAMDRQRVLLKEAG